MIDAIVKLFAKLALLAVTLAGATYVLLGFVGMQERMRVFFSFVWVVMVSAVFLVSSIAIVSRVLKARGPSSSPEQ